MALPAEALRLIVSPWHATQFVNAASPQIPAAQSLSLTFSFLSRIPSYYGVSGVTLQAPNRHLPGTLSELFPFGTSSPFAAITQEAQVIEALRRWESVAQVSISTNLVAQTILPDGTTTEGQITFGYLNLELGVAGAAPFSLSHSKAGGDVWLTSNATPMPQDIPSGVLNPFVTAGQSLGELHVNLVPGTLGFNTLLHEIGHALGLAHPGDFQPYPQNRNSVAYSVMAGSFLPPAIPGIPEILLRAILPATPMVYDVAAVQRMYGANFGYRSSDDNYGMADFVTLTTIWDGGGTDSISLASSADRLRIDLRPGAFSFSLGLANPRILFALAFDPDDSKRNYIENAIGGEGNDELIGNGIANKLEGNAGSDTLDGGVASDAGDTTLGSPKPVGYGDEAVDELVGATGVDTYILRERGGQDVVNDDGLGADGSKDKLEFYGRDGGRLPFEPIIFVQPDGSWRSSSSTSMRWKFEQSGPDLIVTDTTTDAQTKLLNWENGDYGIRKADPLAAPDTTRDIFGDRKFAENTDPRTQQKDVNGDPLAYGAAIPSGTNLLRVYETISLAVGIPSTWLNASLVPDQYVLHHTTVDGAVTTEYYTLPGTVNYLHNTLDDLGNVIRNNEDDLGALDVFNDSSENDQIIGGGGNDEINAFRGGADVIQAGSGRDLINAGAGADLIEAGGDGEFNGEAGGDIAYGGTGDDELYGDVKINLATAISNGASGGGSGSSTKGDFLSGGADTDRLVGSVNADYLDGGSGDDILVGGLGNDNIVGDLGYVAETPQWVIERSVTGTVDKRYELKLISGATLTDNGIAGTDVIYAGAGDDWALAGGGSDYVDMGEGNDVAFGEAGSDILIGGAGDDVLSGDNPDLVSASQEGGDYLDGGAGDDYLFGNGGNDVLIGGINNDVLNGGAGKDTYVFNRGDGIDIIDDIDAVANSPDASVLVLGEGIEREDIKFGKGSLLVDLGPSDPTAPLGGNDQIHFIGFNSGNPSLTAVLGEIRFADGTSMSYDEILAQGFDIDGTPLDDVASTALIGTGVDDRIRGYAGSDDLEGLDGNDTLTGDNGQDRLDAGNGNDILNGGADDDFLAGGMGSDDYHFISGDGSDTLVEGSLFVSGLVDPANTDRIIFGEGIAKEDISLQRTGDGNLVVRYRIGDEIYVEGQYSVPGADIESIVFENDDIITRAELDALVVGEVDGTGNADELYGTSGADVLRGHAGDDYLDGGPAPGRETLGLPTSADNDELDGGTGADTYALYWGMGSDNIIDNADGEVNTLALQDGATIDSVKTGRDGDDLLVTMRGSTEGARVKDFFISGASDWQISSATEGSQSLLDLYTAQSGVANAYALNAMEDYQQRLLGEWRASGQQTLQLPTHVRVQHTYSQTTAQYTVFNPTEQTYTIVHDPITSTKIQGFGIRQGNYTLPLSLANNTVIQRQVNPIVVSSGSDDEFIETEYFGTNSVTTTPYSFFAGGGGVSNLRTYQYISGGGVVNTVTEGSSTGWVPLQLQGAGVGPYQITIRQETLAPVIERITGGAGNNNITGVVSGIGNHVALIDAGAGDDTVTAGYLDFVFGNEGDDSITGGAYSFGGDGSDTLIGGAFMSGGAGSDVLRGGYENTTFSFRSADDGYDTVQDTNGISLQEFAARAGFNESNQVYGGKYRLVGEGINRFYDALTARLGGYPALEDYLSTAFAENQSGLGSYDTTGVSRGVPDRFTELGDGYYSWVYNSIEDVMLDFNALHAQFNLADVSLIPEGVDLSVFKANNYEALRPYFLSGIIETDTVELADYQSGTDTLVIGFAPQEGVFAGRQALRLVWGEDKVIDIELPSVTDLIGYGVEMVRFGDALVYIGDLINVAVAEGIIGTVSNDSLYGTEDADRIRGLGGDDYLSGDGGNDRYVFNLGDGSDIISDIATPSESNRIVFGAGISSDMVNVDTSNPIVRIYVGEGGDAIDLDGGGGVTGSDVVGEFEFANGVVWTYDEFLARSITYTGTSENDFIEGTELNEILYGLQGEDYLAAGSGNDVLDGGADDDYLEGGQGDDTYVFGRDDGVDIVVDEGGSDTLEFKPGVTPDDVTVTTDVDGNSLYFAIVDTDDQVTIQDGLIDPTYAIEHVTFDDGTVWDTAEIERRVFVLNGTSENDEIYGSDRSETLNGLGGDDILWSGGGNDLLNGGTDNDSLVGGYGDDAYIFGRDYGQDVILDENGSDTLRFNADVTPDDVIVTTDSSGENLYFTIAGSEDQITVQYGLNSPDYRIEQVEFADGTVWDAAEIESRITYNGTPDNDNISGSDRGETLNGFAGSDLLYGFGGNDLLDGGLDNDYLSGGQGDDTYIFGVDYGHDIISDEGGSDVLQFKAGVSPEDVIITTDFYQDSIYLTIAGSNDRIVIQSGLSNSDFKVEQVRFADGTVWGTPEIESRIVAGVPTAFDDVLSDTEADDVIDALAGDDLVEAGAGNDILYGNEGNDELYDIEGKNYLSGGDGDDSVGADYGQSILIGGTGNDDLYAYAGNTVIAFNRGDGQDTLYASTELGEADQPVVLSLSGGIQLSDLTLSNYVADGTFISFDLAMGSGDSISITGNADYSADWRLQIVGSDIRTYDLSAAIDAYEAALLIDPEIGEWSAQSTLEGNLLNVSTDHAYGGDIAYQYATNGNTDAMSVTEIQAVLGDMAFGASPQAITTTEGENHLPTVSASDGQVLRNQSVAVSTLFGVTDADNDTITQYEFWDDGASGGYFAINGVEQDANISILVDAADLADTEYVGGADPGTERVWVRAYDGEAWSDWKSWNMTSALHIPNAAPVVTVDAEQTTELNQAIDVSELFGATDADTDAITQYEFWDATAGAGHITVNGIEQGVNVAIAVSAADLANAQFVGSSTLGYDTLSVRASDGQSWSAWKTWTQNSWAHSTNAAPEVTVSNQYITHDQSVDASTLIAVTDADNDAITQYEFRDDGAGGGHFEKNGVAQSAGQTISVTAAELPDVTYVGASANNSEQLWVRAYDGMSWSAWKNWQMHSASGTSNAAPAITADTTTVSLDQSVPASGLFSVSDDDGDPITQYQFWDDGTGGGHFEKNGVIQSAGQAITVTAAELSDVDYVGASANSSEQVWVRAYDGLDWSAWKPWTIQSSDHATNEAPVVSASNTTLLLDEPVEVSGLFDVIDDDNDPITQYEFQDDVNGGGYFSKNGVQQAAGLTFTVSASELADTQYVGAGTTSAEQVSVRAYDGIAWSDWKSWTITSAGHLTNVAPVVSASNATILLDQAVAVSGLFSVADGDGDTITQYEFWDDVNGGGYFSKDGMPQSAGLAISVAAADLADTQYVGASGISSEQLWVRAYDGQAWSAWKNWTITSATHETNEAPVVAAANTTVLLDQTVQASSLFSVSDADTDTITLYEFQDDVDGGGHFEKNGVQQNAGQTISVTSSELATTEYVGASTTGTEQVWARAYDGVAWSNWKNWNITSAPHLTNAAPTVTASTSGVLLEESVQAGGLFGVNDTDGDNITKYEFWDDVNGGGYFSKNGVEQAAGATIAVTDAQLPTLTYVGGATAGTEQVWMRAYDGQEWSNWKNWNMSSLGGMRRGDSGNNTLLGDANTPVLEGQGGDDTLNAGETDSLLHGGSGEDTLNGAGGDDLLVGGAGDDTINTGAGNNIISHNRGDGADTLSGGSGAQNTLSLGGGIDYDDLSLSKSGDDLVIHTGEDESVTLKDWYLGSSYQTLLKIQMMLDATSDFDLNSADPMHNQRVQSFDFLGMVSEFDDARNANTSLTNWQMTNALSLFHLSGSNDAAIGGDLAYYYGVNGGLTGISLNAAQQVIGATGFGQDAQTLRPFSGLQEGLVRLN